VRTEMALSTSRPSSVSDSRRINDELIGNDVNTYLMKNAFDKCNEIIRSIYGPIIFVERLLKFDLDINGINNLREK